MAVIYWTAIELWGRVLNGLNGFYGGTKLIPGQVLGVLAAAAISLTASGLIRAALHFPALSRLLIAAGAAVLGSAAYAASMIVLAKIVPVAQPQGAFGIARFAWETLFFLIPFALWTVIVLVLESGRLVRERDARLSDALIAAREAEIRALHYQVNPHFLYNALNSLSTLILDGRAQQADRMVIRLAAFFRANLTTDPLQEVRLSEEVEKQRLYLSLEELRFNERLQVRLRIPDNLADALVPSLILQPLVENAVKHGIHEPGRTTTVQIDAAKEGPLLRLRVSDDGPGAGAAGGTGVGLENVLRRLRARFGDGASLDLQSEPGSGFVATIRMPLLFGPPADPAPSTPA